MASGSAAGSGVLNLLETDHGTGTVIGPLLAIERDDLSGVLEFTARGVSNHILARDGEIVFVDGGTVSETLGRILIRSSRMTEEQVAHVIRRMIDTLVDDDYVRFGETVVEYGFLTADELDDALTQQMKEKLMGCVHRGAGDWRFIQDNSREALSASFVVRTRPMLVDAASFLAEREVERILSLDENRYPELVAPDSVVIEEFELSKEEAKILRDLDGTQSIHFIFSMTSSILVSPIITALFLGGGLELRTTPDPTRQPSESRSIPHAFRTARRAKFVGATDALASAGTPPLPTEVGPDAAPHAPLPRFPSSPSLPPSPTRPLAHSSPTIAIAPASGPTRRSSRDKLVAAMTPEMVTRAQEALDRLKTDLDHRKPVSKRRRWPDPKDDRERKLMAESAFHQGRLHLRNGEAERALPGLHRALELCPEELEYELYVKWAQMIVNDAFKDEARRADVQWLAEKIVRVSRECELGYSILGHCTMHDGRDEAALRFFQRAALLDPKLVDSGHFSRHLAMRSANKLRKPLPSKVDAALRRAERGHLDTPLDEIVPMLRERPTDISESIAKNAAKEGARLKAKAQRQRVSSAGEFGVGVPTPRGGLRASEPSIEQDPLLTETPAVAMMVTAVRDPSPDATLEAAPPPPVTAVLPPPSSKPASLSSAGLRTATMMSPWRVPPQPPTAHVEQSEPPAVNDATEAFPGPPALPSVPPERSGSQETTAVLATAPMMAQPMMAQPMMAQPLASLPAEQAVTSPPVAPPPPPLMAPLPVSVTPQPPAHAPRHSSEVDLPTGKPRHGRAIAIAFAWIASLAVTGSLLYFCGIKEGAFGIFPTAPSTNAGAVSASTSEIRNPPPSSAIAETTASPPATRMPATPTPATPTPATPTPATPTPAPAPSSPASAASTSSSASGKTTTILRAPKAYGRRIYVDGHIVGEGGRDLTVNCGPHRVKVGSTGQEKTLSLPCGGVIEVE